MKEELKKLIQIVVSEEASDLHLSEGRYPTIRVSGALIPITKSRELSEEDLSILLNLILTPDQRERFIANKEMDFAFEAGGVRFRGNAYYQQGDVSIALRQINNKVSSLEELGLPSILETFAKKEQGFFLVVGPTGHGKSTTLATLIDIINQSRTEHIVTIEDPVEFLFEQKQSIIDQREVGFDTRNFSAALRSAFRQDIDVLMIGEMRGPETMETAITAAETGHLVFSTLHTNTASQTIDRIIDTFSGDKQKQIRTQLSSSLMGIFSQRLIPSVSGGRVPAYELLINTPAVSNLIREGRIHEIDSFIETSSQHGMISLNRSLATLVREGEISVEDAYRYSPQSKNLDRLL
ncbi:MAG: type IV pilus twitching motility protein PilT [Patescibacteria group bacterium]